MDYQNIEIALQENKKSIIDKHVMFIKYKKVN